MELVSHDSLSVDATDNDLEGKFDIGNHIYTCESYGPPVVSSYIIKYDSHERNVIFNYPSRNFNRNKCRNTKLVFSDSRFMYTHDRNVEEELNSCEHLIIDLASGALKPSSLADFVYFILPTSSGNSLYGISYVARFLENNHGNVNDSCDKRTLNVHDSPTKNSSISPVPHIGGDTTGKLKKKIPTGQEMDEVIGLDENVIIDDETNQDYYFISVCLILNVPFFVAIGSRFECVAQTYFSTRDFSDYTLLSSFVDQINNDVSIDNLPYESLYFNLESYFKPSVLSLSSRGLLFMLKCILSEQKIAVYSQSAARCSTCILSLLTMIPGANSLNFNSKGFGVMWHEWKCYGMPLHLFHSKNVLLPYFKDSMIDLVNDCKGYIIGITDLNIVTNLKNGPTLLLDLECDLIKLRSKDILSIYTPSMYEITLFDELSYIDESDDENLRLVEETGEAFFSAVGDYFSKAPSTIVEIGGKAVRMCKFKSRSRTRTRRKESVLKMFDMYFPGAIPSFLRQQMIQKKTYDETYINTESFFEDKQTIEPFTFSDVFSKMYEKYGKYKYKYFGYISSLQNDRYNPDRNLEIEYAHNNRINPIQDYLLKLLKCAAYVGGENRLVHNMIMEFAFDLESAVDYSLPVTGVVIRQGEEYIRANFPVDFDELDDDDDYDQYHDAQGKNDGSLNTRVNNEYLKEGETLVKFTVPSMLASSILEIQNDYSIEFIELWVQTMNARKFFFEHELELFNEPIFFLNSELAKYKYPNGDVYIGELSDMLRSGRGTYISKDGSRYDGQWKNDKRHGKGSLYYKDGNYRYNGEWFIDKKHGKGHLETPEFEYIGEFSNNKFHGRGILKNKDGSVLEGNFKSGKFHGQGMLTLPDGSVQMGTFKNNEIVGVCSLVGKDGRAYVGKLHGNLPNGNGTMKYDEYTSFEGFWDKGKRSKQEKITVEGIWEDDEMLMDDVLITFPSGSKYNGPISYFDKFTIDDINVEVLDDFDYAEETFDKLFSHILPHGHGVCKTPDGSIYNGQFVCGMRFGKGTIVLPNGVIYNGLWYFGHLHGTGTLHFSEDNIKNVMFERGKLVTDLENCKDDINKYFSYDYTVFEYEFTKYNIEPALKVMKKTN